jgi:predicted RNase H-like nuclease (RuvC/YqgF family)|tara:strand:+ start:159 stop:347 length:189 start_codon:yes stop_codon:yes gene_type:complete
MTYEGMFEEVEASKKVKELKKTIDVLETENSIKDYEITQLKEKIDMLKKQKKILQDSIRKHK